MAASVGTVLLLCMVAVAFRQTGAVTDNESDLAESQRHLLHYHWGYFLYGVFFSKERGRAEARQCPRFQRKAEAKGMEFDCSAQAKRRRVAIATAVIESGIPYEETEDGIAFGALPSSVSVEAVESGTSVVSVYQSEEVVAEDAGPVTVEVSTSVTAGHRPEGL